MLESHHGGAICKEKTVTAAVSQKPYPRITLALVLFEIKWKLRKSGQGGCIIPGSKGKSSMRALLKTELKPGVRRTRKQSNGGRRKQQAQRENDRSG